MIRLRRRGRGPTPDGSGAPDPATTDGPDESAMTLTEHLAELRVRIIRSALAIVLGAVLILAFYDQVLGFLRGPYDDLCARKPEGFCESQLFTLDPLEGLSTRLRIASWGGIILALPVILWQIWRFVVPALHAKEKRYAIPFVLSSVLLFALGGSLAFFTLERALEFLIAWSGDDVQAAFQVSRYVRLVGLMVMAFGVGFLFPVLLVFLQLVGVISPRNLLGAWRYATVGVVVLAAVITPSGDPISLAMLSGPLLVFYFLSIAIGYLFERRQRRAPAAA